MDGRLGTSDHLLTMNIARGLKTPAFFIAAVSSLAGSTQAADLKAASMIDFSLIGFSGLFTVYNVHPAFVHFPIVLFPVSLFFYLLGFVRRSSSLLMAGRILLYLAALSGTVTVWTGWLAAKSVPHNEAIHRMILTHQTTGFIILGLAVILVLWSFWAENHRPKAAWGFLLGLAAVSLLVLMNGDLGSRMVYLEGAAVKPAVQTIAPRAEDGQGRHGHSHAGHSHAH